MTRLRLRGAKLPGSPSNISGEPGSEARSPECVDGLAMLPLSDEPSAHWGSYPSGLRATPTSDLHPREVNPRAPSTFPAFVWGQSWGPHTALTWPGSLSLGLAQPQAVGAPALTHTERGSGPACRVVCGCDTPLVPGGPPGETTQRLTSAQSSLLWGFSLGPGAPVHLPVSRGLGIFPSCFSKGRNNLQRPSRQNGKLLPKLLYNFSP